MKPTLIASAALAAIAVVSGPQVFAQQANYCDPSGYVTGVASDRDNPHQACDPRSVPRVNGVPQQQPAPDARRGGYVDTPRQAYDQRRYDQQRYDQRYGQQRYYSDRDPRYMANRGDWERYRDGDHYYGARGPEWRRGAHIPREYMGRQYWVSDWRAHRLAPPPRGYQWVQVGNDYVLVALATGIIAQLLLAQ
jgi:Ni/Co efflux regulator RcnB